VRGQRVDGENKASFWLICVVSAFALVFFGLVGISAATQPGYEFSGFMTDYVRTQLIAFAAGLLVGLIILYVGFAYVVKVAPYLAVFNVVLLLITLDPKLIPKMSPGILHGRGECCLTSSLPTYRKAQLLLEDSETAKR